MDTQPTPAGFLNFVRNVMGVPTDVLPDDSLVLVYALQVALLIVNQKINAASPAIYTLAVYNLAGDNLINYAQDLPPFPDPPALPFWAALRKSYGSNNFVAGVVSSASDEGTSSSYDVIKTLETLTIGQLQNLKTPYGRQYLAFASQVGTNWGLS